MSESASTLTTTTASPAFDRVLPSDKPLLLKTKALESRTLQSRVPYSIYVHHLNPSDSFGHVGDIFYALQTRSIFWKDKSDGWIQWQGIYKSGRSREQNAQHPLHPKFLLFLSENTHATWQTEDGFRTSCNRLLKRLASEPDIKPTVPYVVQSASFFVDQLWERRSRYPEVFGGQESPGRPAKRQRTNSRTIATSPTPRSTNGQPSTETLKSVGYADFYRGTRFPFDCPSITWGDDRKNILPYVTSSNGQNLDTTTVQAMLTYPDALSTPHAPIKIVTLPPATSSQLELRKQLIQDIRSALANRELVLVKGWYCEDPLSLANKESILHHARSTQTCFKSQDVRTRTDALLRGEDPESITLDIGTFLSNVENPEVCQQIDDFSAYSPQVPFFIRDLSDGDSAFRVTQHLIKSNNSLCNTCGSTTMSHGGFLSYPRENSSASCMYTHVIEGRKLVTILLPASSDQELCTSQIQELHSVPMSRTRRTVPGYSLWLEPGDTLLQPPLTYRAVYSTEESICTEDTFELFDTLHLKLQYFMATRLRDDSITRMSAIQAMPILGTLCRMALSMGFQLPSRTVPLASIYALTILIVRADEFRLSETKDEVPEYQLARETILKWLHDAGIQEAVDVMQSLILRRDTALSARQVRLQ